MGTLLARCLNAYHNRPMFATDDGSRTRFFVREMVMRSPY